MIQYSHCPVLPSLVSNYIFYFSSPGTKYRGTSRFKSSAISYNLEVGPSKKVKVTQSGMMTRMTLTLVREYKRLNLESLLTCFYFYFLWGGVGLLQHISRKEDATLAVTNSTVPSRVIKEKLEHLIIFVCYDGQQGHFYTCVRNVNGVMRLCLFKCDLYGYFLFLCRTALSLPEPLQCFL